MLGEKRRLGRRTLRQSYTAEGVILTVTLRREEKNLQHKKATSALPHLGNASGHPVCKRNAHKQRRQTSAFPQHEDASLFPTGSKN